MTTFSAIDSPPGSSPHTRGALPLDREAIAAGGGDHPRIRGEHTIWCSGPSDTTGSSPHTRGARRRARRGVITFRIIPAYAGSTRNEAMARTGMKDHPRIRGEHNGGGRLDPDRSGIIPAYAGSTRGTEIAREPQSDHPRIRGEHHRRHGRGFCRQGSSPHTRGALSLCRMCRAGTRIIPAYAGSTADARRSSSTPTDHPRIRGEHKSTRSTDSTSPGSSPHTRGARVGCSRAW